MEREGVVKILQEDIEEKLNFSLEERDSFKESGMDSLDRFLICIGAERYFDIVLGDAEFEKVDTLGELADLVLQKLG